MAAAAPDTRIVEATGWGGSSLRVAIPPRIRNPLNLTSDDELRLAVTECGNVAMFAKGVPFTDDLRLYAGNASLAQHKRQLKVVILRDARDALGIEAGDSLSIFLDGEVIYAVKPGSSN